MTAVLLLMQLFLHNNETINGDKTFNDKVICKNLYINGYKCTIE